MKVDKFVVRVFIDLREFSECKRCAENNKDTSSVADKTRINIRLQHIRIGGEKANPRRSFLSRAKVSKCLWNLRIRMPLIASDISGGKGGRNFLMGVMYAKRK